MAKSNGELLKDILRMYKITSVESPKSRSKLNFYIKHECYKSLLGKLSDAEMCSLSLACGCMKALFPQSRFFFSESKINGFTGYMGVESFQIKSKELTAVLYYIGVIEDLYGKDLVEKRLFIIAKNYEIKLWKCLDYLEGCEDSYTYACYGVDKKSSFKNRIFVEWHCLDYDGFLLFSDFLNLYRMVKKAYKVLGALFKKQEALINYVGCKYQEAC